MRQIFRLSGMLARMGRVLVMCSLGVLALAACSGAKPAPSPQPSTPGRSGELPPPALADASWGKVPLPRFALEFELPNQATWKLDDRKGWFTATHDATSTSVAVFTWAAPRSARPRDCEAEARIRRAALPSVDEADVVDRRRMSIPSGFDSELTVIALPSANTGYIDGHALLFGATTGRCFAAAFSTRATGDGAQAEIARRLKIGVDGIFTSFRVLDVEDRARPPKE